MREQSDAARGENDAINVIKTYEFAEGVRSQVTIAMTNNNSPTVEFKELNRCLDESPLR